MTKEQSKAHWWIVENHPDFRIKPPKKYFEICDIVYNALNKGQTLPIDSVRLSLPLTNQQICDMAKTIVDKQKEASKITKPIDWGSLEEDWFDWLKETLFGNEA